MSILTNRIKELKPGDRLTEHVNDWHEALAILNDFVTASELTDSDPIGSCIIERRTDGTLLYTWSIRSLHAVASPSKENLAPTHAEKNTTIPESPLSRAQKRRRSG